jgi:hypothetical protein
LSVDVITYCRGQRPLTPTCENKIKIAKLILPRYLKIAQSELLPELDLDLLANYVNHPHPLEAMLSFQAAIRHH